MRQIHRFLDLASAGCSSRDKVRCATEKRPHQISQRVQLRSDLCCNPGREALVHAGHREAAIEKLDDILSVPQLGFVVIGPLGLSVSLGYPGKINHPEIQAAVETIRATAIGADVHVGGFGFGMDDVNEKAANSYQNLNLGSTTGALKQTVNGWFDAYTNELPANK